MTNANKSAFLKKTLSINAVVTALLGLLLAVYAQSTANLLSLDGSMGVYIVAAGICLLAIDLAYLATRNPPNTLYVLLLTLADFVWPVVSICLLLYYYDDLATLAQALVLSIAATRLLFAELQIAGILRMLRNDGKGARLALEFKQALPVPASQAWPVISNVGGYARYVNNLASSTILKGEAVGMLRECQDTQGKRWTEECVAWEEGSHYAFRVNTQAADYPYPFKTLDAEWRLLDDGNRCTILLRFNLSLPWGIIGDLLLAATLPGYQKELRYLFQAWEQAVIAGDAPQREIRYEKKPGSDDARETSKAKDLQHST